MSPSSRTERRSLSGARVSTEAREAELESLPGLLAWGGVLALLALAPEFFSGFWPVDYDYWPQSIFLLSTATLSLFCALGGFKLHRFSTVDWLVAAFAGWCLLSVATSTYFHDSFLEVGRVLGISGWYFLVRAVASRGEASTRMHQVLIALTGGVALVALQVVFRYLQNHDPRQFGTFFNPNLLANALAMSLAPALCLIVLARRSGRSALMALFAVQFLVLAVALCFTSSKGGFLSGAAGMATAVIAASHGRGRVMREQIRKYWAVLMVAAILVGILALKMILPRLTTHFAQGDYSSLFRYYTWMGTLRMAESRPVLGFGPGTFPSIYPQFAETGYTRSAHQFWLQLAAESGFPAMLLLVAACGTALVTGWRRLRDRDWPVTAGAMGALVAFAVHGITDAGWGITSIGILCFTALALASGPSKSQAAEAEAQPSRLRFSWIGVTAVLALGGFYAQRAALAEDEHLQAETLIDRQASTMAVQHARAAAATDPLSSRMQNGLAAALVSDGNPVEAEKIYESGIALQPRRASNWLNLARINDLQDDGKAASEAFDKAVELDPNDTSIRLERAKWRLAHKDLKGWDDIEFILGQRTKPYGRYAATPEFVNLDYARATAAWVPKLRADGAYTKARDLIAIALDEVARARANQALEKQMMQELGPGSSLRPATDLDELERQLLNDKSFVEADLQKKKP